MLEAKNISLQVKNKSLVKGLNFCFEPGKHYAICGPNGAGKSTFLKLLALEIPASEGSVYYNGEKSNYTHLPALSKYRAVLSQQLDIGFPLTVEEIILMGRYPHANTSTKAENEAICRQAMDWVEVTQFANRDYNTLSGGEKQRVQFARVLTQIWDPPPGKIRYLMLDEPITFLDLKHQFDFLQKVKKLTDGRTVVISVLHDLNLVMQYADEVLLMHNGSICNNGKPRDVLSAENLKKVFDVDSRLMVVDGNQFLYVG